MEFISKLFGLKPKRDKQLILVVDDDDEVAGILTLFLTKKGFLIERARDGVEGLELFQKLSPNLVILDITMPKMNGFELLVKLKSSGQGSSTPVLMCTDHNLLNDVEKSNNFGADGYILKPFQLDRVLQKITDTLTPISP